MRIVKWLWNWLTKQWRGRHAPVIYVPVPVPAAPKVSWIAPWDRHNERTQIILATLDLEMWRVRVRHFDSPNARARRARRKHVR